MRVGLVDYGLGNLQSVENALLSIGAASDRVVDSSSKLNFDTLVVPGVAAFGPGVQNLRERGLDLVILSAYQSGVPIVGLCLGAQMLLDGSEEAPGVPGLGIVRGYCKRISTTEGSRTFQGWSRITDQAAVFQEVAGGHYFFSHSFSMHISDPLSSKTYAEHGEPQVLATFQKDRVFGIQFHPEKSGPLGLALLESAIRAS